MQEAQRKGPGRPTGSFKDKSIEAGIRRTIADNLKLFSRVRKILDSIVESDNPPDPSTLLDIMTTLTRANETLLKSVNYIQDTSKDSDDSGLDLEEFLDRHKAKKGK